MGRNIWPWTAPDAETGAYGSGFPVNVTETVGKLLAEAVRIDPAVETFPVYGTGIEGVDVEDYPVFVVHPLEKFEVDEGIGFRGASVGIVEPREILRRGGLTKIFKLIKWYFE